MARIRLTNFVLADGGLEADLEELAAHVDPGAPPAPLPDGYDRDERVAATMFLSTMKRYNVDSIAVQGHGSVVVADLKLAFPTLDVYAHPRSDALMWPGFGSIDTTIDSGRGGFYFRPDHQGQWEPDPARRG